MERTLVLADPGGVVARGEAAPPRPSGRLPKMLARPNASRTTTRRGTPSARRCRCGMPKPRDLGDPELHDVAEHPEHRPDEQHVRPSIEIRADADVLAADVLAPSARRRRQRRRRRRRRCAGRTTGPNATKLRKSGLPPAMTIAGPASTMKPVKMKACRAPIAAAEETAGRRRAEVPVRRTSSETFRALTSLVATTGWEFERGPPDGWRRRAEHSGLYKCVQVLDHCRPACLALAAPQRASRRVAIRPCARRRHLTRRRGGTPWPSTSSGSTKAPPARAPSSSTTSARSSASPPPS